MRQGAFEARRPIDLDGFGHWRLAGILAAVAAIGWFGAMVLLLARLTQVAGSPRFQRWLEGVTGVVFIGFGMKLARYESPL